MEFSVKALEVTQAGYKNLLAMAGECLVLGVFESEDANELIQAFDHASAGLLSRLLKKGEINGKRGTHTLLHEMPGVAAQRVLFIGLGKAAEFNDRAWLTTMQYTLASLNGTRATDVIWAFPLPQQRDFVWASRMAVQVIREHDYDFIKRYPALQSKQKNQREYDLQKIVWMVPESLNAEQKKAAEEALQQGVAIASGMELTRDLANLPPNICTPTYLAECAQKLAQEQGLKVEVLEKKQIATLKMGAFLAVAQGSIEPPKLIVLKYQGGAADEKPIVLVGKGITFDSGGISIKPGEAMDEMKFDMCGAATVLGSLLAAAQMKLKKNIVAIVPTCENMPSGAAVKPGDVVVSMSGQTIEVLNTDAEGRLILCDALTYAERLNPALVVDVATLTGACVIALGRVNSGMYTRDDDLAEELISAGKYALDPVWRMPLDEAYQEQLKSNFADMANIGGRPAGSVTAACFLARYTEKYKWAHLDIAGTAWQSGTKKGATARPVPLLTHFLLASV